MTPRILFLSHSASWGGAEKCLFELVSHLPREGIEPVVLLPSDGDLSAAYGKLGIETRQAPLPWSMGYSRHQADQLEQLANGLDERVKQLSALIRDERIALVFTNTITVADGALAAAAVGVPHAWHILELLSQDSRLLSLLPLDWLYSSVDALSDAVVVVSNAVRLELQGVSTGMAPRVVHTGIEKLVATARDKRATLGIEPTKPVVAYVGELSERKGVEVLALAIPSVLARHSEAHFVFVGADGGRERELRGLIAQHRLEQSVTLTGPRKDIADVLAASDVFVLPSLADPLPVTVLEAMSMSLPVVATRSGGCEEMVMDGETGLLVPPSNSQALSIAINELLSDRERAGAMGKSGYERFVTCFSVDRYAEEFSSILVECAARGPRQSGRRSRAAHLGSLLRKAALDQSKIFRLEQQYDEKVAELEQQVSELQRRVDKFERHPVIGRLLRWRRKLLGLPAR